MNTFLNLVLNNTVHVLLCLIYVRQCSDFTSSGEANQRLTNLASIANVAFHVCWLTLLAAERHNGVGRGESVQSVPEFTDPGGRSE